VNPCVHQLFLHVISSRCLADRCQSCRVAQVGPLQRWGVAVIGPGWLGHSGDTGIPVTQSEILFLVRCDALDDCLILPLALFWAKSGRIPHALELNII